MTNERCEDEVCGTGAAWPTCSADCVCACHDYPDERGELGAYQYPLECKHA